MAISLREKRRYGLSGGAVGCYEIQALFTPPPVPLIPEGLIKAVRFYEQVKRENPPVETGAWKDAVDWVLEEACQAVNIRIKGE